MKLCPHCQQPLPEIRLGVRLTAKKARIFDLVQRAGPDGIDGRDLFAIVFGEQEKEVKRDTLQSHVWQINDLIEDSGYRIKGYSTYRLVRRD